MKELKRINLKFISMIILLLLTFVVFLGVIYFASQLEQYFFVVFFLDVLLALWIFVFLRNQIYIIINQKYYQNIINNLGEPLPVNRAFNQQVFSKNLKHLGFLKFSQNNSYTIYYRTSKDPIKKIFRGYLLEVIVYTSLNENEFYLEQIDDELDHIVLNAKKQGERVTHTLMTITKPVFSLTDDVKSKLNETFFLKTNNMVFSTINIALDQSTSKAVFIYSDSYSPSLYYNHHIELIKKSI
jgi:hypothetical protein